MKCIFFSMLLLACCNAGKLPDTAGGRKITEQFVYFIEYGEKTVQSDNSYYYSSGDYLQFSSSKELGKEKLKEIAVQKITSGGISDTAFIGVDFVYFDDLKKNDSVKSAALSKQIADCKPIKRSSNYATQEHVKFNGSDIQYTVEEVKGEWVELILDRKTAEQILGRTLRFFNKETKECRLFVMLNQS